MEKQQRVLISLTFLLSLIGIVLIVVSFATDHWVESNPTLLENSTGKHSEANFGMFKGYRIINSGLGARRSEINVKCIAKEGVCVIWPETGKTIPDKTPEEYVANAVGNRSDGQPLYELGLFNYGFWVTIIICAAMTVMFGVISMGFAVFNLCGKPIETITGPMGLYIWNGMAFLFSLLEMAMFLALFLTTLKNNFLLRDEISKFDIAENTSVGYSFFLLPGAVAMYLINILLLVCSGYKLRCSFGDEAEKVADNGMILY